MTSGPVPASAQWSAIPFPRSTRRCMTSIRARYYPDESLATVRARHGCAAGSSSSYFDNTGRPDVGSGGVRRIAIDTPNGKFHVWTKRVGNNPSLKVLTLHGGPAATHEYFEIFDTHLPAAGI